MLKELDKEILESGSTLFHHLCALTMWQHLQVLLIGGSTGTMLEALQVVGEGHDGSLNEVRSLLDYLPHISLCN